VGQTEAIRYVHTDLVLVNGRYVAIEYMDDGDGPILDSGD